MSSVLFKWVVKYQKTLKQDNAMHSKSNLASCRPYHHMHRQHEWCRPCHRAKYQLASAKVPSVAIDLCFKSGTKLHKTMCITKCDGDLKASKQHASCSNKLHMTFKHLFRHSSRSNGLLLSLHSFASISS